MQKGDEPYFVIQEKYFEHQAMKIIMSVDIIERMIRQSRFKMGKITVQLSSRLSETEMSLYLGDGAPFLISRFPRSLVQDDDVRERT